MTEKLEVSESAPMTSSSVVYHQRVSPLLKNLRIHMLVVLPLKGTLRTYLTMTMRNPSHISHHLSEGVLILYLLVFVIRL